MATLTFDDLLQAFQREATYQEVIQHGLSDILRAGDDEYFPGVAASLDRAAATSDQGQAEAELQAALESLEQVTGPSSLRQSPDTPVEPLSLRALGALSPAEKQRGYYVASLSWAVSSLLSLRLGQREHSTQAASHTILTFQLYRDTVQEHLKRPTIYYPPSRANPSSTSKPKPSLHQWLNHEYKALHKLLTQWLGAGAVKAMVLDYSR